MDGLFQADGVCLFVRQAHSPRLGLFLDAFILNRIPSTTDTATGPTLPTAYLAQSDLPPHPIFDRDTPSLPHFSCGPRGEVYRRTLWVGPGGSFTPFHRDPYIGIYSQSGYKRILAPVPYTPHISCLYSSPLIHHTFLTPQTPLFKNFALCASYRTPASHLPLAASR
jgi:hypothetical protein